MATLPFNEDIGRVAYWRVMTALQAHYGEFTSRVVVDIAGVGHRKTIENYLAFLVAEKVVLVAGRDDRGPTGTYRYRIVNPGEAPPFRGRGQDGKGARQQALWTAMRSLRSFSASQLALTASTDVMPIARETASGYVADLLRAGYLTVIGRSEQRAQTQLYGLLPARNTGPRAPIVQRPGNACFDLNLMRTVNLNKLATTEVAA